MCQCIVTRPKPWCCCWCQFVVTQTKSWCCCWCQCVVTQPKPWCSCRCQFVVTQSQLSRWSPSLVSQGEREEEYKSVKRQVMQKNDRIELSTHAACTAGTSVKKCQANSVMFIFVTVYNFLLFPPRSAGFECHGTAAVGSKFRSVQPESNIHEGQ